MRDRKTHGRRQHRLRRIVIGHVDLAVHAVAFPVDRHVLRPLLDLHRERCAPHCARHAGPDAITAGVVVEREVTLVLRGELLGRGCVRQLLRRLAAAAAREIQAAEVRMTAARGLRESGCGATAKTIAAAATRPATGLLIGWVHLQKTGGYRTAQPAGAEEVRDAREAQFFGSANTQIAAPLSGGFCSSGTSAA